MPRYRSFFMLVIAAMLAVGCASQRAARETPASIILDARWEASLAAFAEADRTRTPAPGGVLFVGSSSIRLWDRLEQQFNMHSTVINRGFGGSSMADCAAYVDRLVLPYKPKLVLVYAGDNDLAEGRTPQQVHDSFRTFVGAVRQSLPDTRIAYISIKPSPARQHLLGEIRRTNTLIRDYVRRAGNTQFIDIHAPMLDERGLPRPELFRADRLHLNDEGYALWKSVIAAAISEPTGAGR